MDYREGPMVSVREFCEIYEIAVPIKKEVCPVCEGHGIHVNPAIDSHGVSSEEFWDDPDFGEDYFSGRYDVRCNRCQGLRVVDTIDFENCPPGTEDLWNEYQNDVYEHRAEMAAEMRMMGVY